MLRIDLMVDCVESEGIVSKDRFLVVVRAGSIGGGTYHCGGLEGRRVGIGYHRKLERRVCSGEKEELRSLGCSSD